MSAVSVERPQFNSHVLMSGADYMSNDLELNPYMHANEPFRLHRAIQQHHIIKKALTRAGVKVDSVKPPRYCQDGVFVANEALLGIDEETMLMARLPKGREAETPYYTSVLRTMGKRVLHLPNEAWYFSGQGDALRYGSYLFAGQGFRTSPGSEVHDFIEDTLGYDVVRLQTVGLINENGSPNMNIITGLPNSEFYDIDYAIAPILWPTETERGVIAVCKEAFTEESLAKITGLPQTDIIWVPYEEATGVSACNLVSTGRAVVMNAGAPVLEQALRERGLSITTTQNDELKKNGGSVRCTTLTLQHVV